MRVFMVRNTWRNTAIRHESHCMQCLVPRVRTRAFLKGSDLLPKSIFDLVDLFSKSSYS